MDQRPGRIEGYGGRVIVKGAREVAAGAGEPTFARLHTGHGADAQQVDFGLNYYLPHNLRLNGSYGRQFSSLGNANVWNVQVTYRFLFPLIPEMKSRSSQ